ncbi:hypothetical protein MKW98_030306 [Papaver atlanticum]|uniref:Uncharacterized protein n=1 Tax=Papaver atlanticum TaxID=357466 RepID=A0AAD4TIW0_9MAGN|nr:hypothetical protein MKW98_030306 [Papaver atlanticum]
METHSPLSFYRTHSIKCLSFSKLTRSALEIRSLLLSFGLLLWVTGKVILYIYNKKGFTVKRRADGICITNYGKTWEKLMMAKAYYVKG